MKLIILILITLSHLYLYCQKESKNDEYRQKSMIRLYSNSKNEVLEVIYKNRELNSSITLLEFDETEDERLPKSIAFKISGYFKNNDTILNLDCFEEVKVKKKVIPIWNKIEKKAGDFGTPNVSQISGGLIITPHGKGKPTEVLLNLYTEIESDYEVRKYYACRHYSLINQYFDKIEKELIRVKE